MTEEEMKMSYIRWSENHRSLVQQAAEYYGMPLQSYMRYVLLKQAVVDIKNYEAILPGE